MTAELGSLKQVDPRDVWPHEARDLTPWLLKNDHLLAEALGIELKLTGAEHAVGPFSLDLVGHDLTHDCVLVVENQLTPTDHSHLGQLLTYAAGTKAGTVVWVAPYFRDEHREALALLNTLGGEEMRFFGIQISTVRIGDSLPAPLLDVQVQPNDWAARIANLTRAVTRGGSKAAAYSEFWSVAVERIRSSHPDWTHDRRPGPDNWLNMRPPFPGVGAYSISFCRDGQIRSEYYIDHPQDSRANAVFESLRRRRDKIERRFGHSLQWEELDGHRASRIATYSAGDVLDVDRHDEILAWFVDNQERLRAGIEEVRHEVEGDLAG